MRENIKISKIDKKKRNKLLKNKIKFLLKKIEFVLYLFDKCLKMKLHKILEHQKRMLMYLPLGRSYYFKHILSII